MRYELEFSPIPGKRTANLGLKRGTVLLAQYNGRWVMEYDKIRQELTRILGRTLVSIHHIGSTSIPCMTAKPILDVGVVIENFHNLDSFQEELEKNGYIHRPLEDKPDQKLYIKGNEEMRTHHIHFIIAQSPVLSDYLFFRDYLISHPDSAVRYAELKRNLAREYHSDRMRYTKGKESFIQNILAKRKNA